MTRELPLLLMHGLGVDWRFFQAQAAAIRGLVAIRRIPPEPNESLSSYARRLAATVDPGGPCLVGGHSMGGMLALEMALHLQARACLLISSVRSPKELPLRARAGGLWLPLVPGPCAGLPGVVLGGVLAVGRRRLAPEVVSLLEQFSQTEGRFLKWAALAVVRWRPSFQEPPVPVAHIHGARDFILPARLTRPDVLVPRAGHMLPITHPEIVNAFLREQRERFAM